MLCGVYFYAFAGSQLVQRLSRKLAIARKLADRVVDVAILRPVREASLLEQLSSGEVSEEEMAQQLNMSRRTLQRKLAEAETTYQQLVDATRRDLALRYIENPGQSITDITFMLGFSQQSAFTRAFRRWTGYAPTEYRVRSVKLGE